MDIIGITEGLKRINKPSNITVYLTNGYVIDTLTKGLLEKWKKNGFKKKKHVDLWMELDKIITANSHSIAFLHSRDVRFSKDFQQAELLGKDMSGKRNLPNDLREFWIKHFDTKQQLKSWYQEASKAEWKNPNEIKQDYPSASFLANNRIVLYKRK